MLRIGALFLIFVLPGCGSNNSRVPISGQVTFKGASVVEGAIQFFPQDVNKGDATGAMIRDGRYSIGEEHGLPPGIYAVRISAPNFKGKRPLGTDLPGSPYLAAELIPEKYNQKSTLTVEVTIGSPGKMYDFALE